MKKAMNFWSGRLNNIDSWECFIYDKMTETDKKKKDTFNRKYYRYYNDGDFPRGLRDKNGVPVSSWMGKDYIKEALEDKAYEVAKYFIKKYMTAENRAEYYKWNEANIFNNISDAFDRMDRNISYWTKDSSKCKKILEKINIGVLEMVSDMYCKEKGMDRYVLPYVFEKTGDKESEEKFKKIFEDKKNEFIKLYNEI